MKWTQLKEKKIGLWGMGKEGEATQEALKKFVPSAKIIPFTDETLSLMDKCDIVVKTPGVSLYRPEIEQAQKKGIIFTSGTNLFLANKSSKTKVIGITGTKGKSTTSSLLAHTLKEMGLSVSLAGNIGVPLVQLLQEKPTDYVVAELSSYQCADLSGSIDLAVLLDLYPEHLQWHKTHNQYYMDKIRMVSQANYSIINGSDERILSLWNTAIECDFFNTFETIHLDKDFFMDDKEKIFERESLNLIGEHNAINACAVLTVLKELKLDLKKAQEPFKTFIPLPHRLQTVFKTNTLTFIDDSISTTPETAIAGLIACDKNTKMVLIAGGLDRGQDFSELAHFIAINKEVLSVVGLPNTGEKLVEQVKSLGGNAFYVEKMQEAVEKSISLIGDKIGIILLSPASPSYNAYKNFEERGKDFLKQIQSHFKQESVDEK